MIVQLTGTLVELTASHVVLDVGGVGYELGVSAVTAGSLPEVGTPGVTLLARLIVREDSMTLASPRARSARCSTACAPSPAWAPSSRSPCCPRSRPPSSRAWWRQRTPG